MIEKISNKFSLGAILPNVKFLSKKIDEIIDWINGTKGNGSYKEYTGYINQNGTNTPTIIIKNNTLRYNPTLSYVSDGIYSMDFPANTLNKIFVIEGNRSFYVDNTNNINVSLNIVSTTIDIVSRYNGVPADDLINQVSDNYCISIRIYN